MSSPEVSAATTVLVFSHRPEVREAITMAIGRRPAPDLPRVRFVEVGGVADVLAAMDAGGVDLAILDGEAQPTGGMGLSRQLKDEITDCPPIIVAVRREGRPLAGHLVAGRRGARAPARPADRRRDRRRRAAPHPRRAARARLTAARMGDVQQTWPALLARLIAGTDLDAQDTAWVMDQVIAGEATPVQLAGFLVALRSKGETAAEITGLAEAMLRHTRRVVVPGRAVDIVGTGGDRANTVNISTMAAVVVAAAGVPVVKHGNRAATRRAGRPTCWRSSG